MAHQDVGIDDLIVAWQNDPQSITRIQAIAAANGLREEETYRIFAKYVWPNLFDLPMAYDRATSDVKHASWTDFLTKYQSRSIDGKYGRSSDPDKLDAALWWG